MSKDYAHPDKYTIVICGGGSLGSRIAHELATPGIHFVIVDDDQVEEQNLRVTTYTTADLARDKAHALSDQLKAKGSSAEGAVLTLTDAAQLPHVHLILDCFDNPEARRVLCGGDTPTLHVGVGEEGNGIVFWDEDYRPPEGSTREENPVCTGGLGTRIIRRTAMRAVDVVEDFLRNGAKNSQVVATHG